jgi:multiple sugar transport system substrate-binding protein
MNATYCNYFRNTLPALDSAFLRPLYPGYICFQGRAGVPIRGYLRGGGNERRVLADLDALYRQSRRERQQ